MYMVTQLAKMLFLATFFPVAVDEEEDPNVEVPFDFLTVSDLTSRFRFRRGLKGFCMKENKWVHGCCEPGGFAENGFRVGLCMESKM